MWNGVYDAPLATGYCISPRRNLRFPLVINSDECIKRLFGNEAAIDRLNAGLESKCEYWRASGYSSDTRLKEKNRMAQYVFERFYGAAKGWFIGMNRDPHGDVFRYLEHCKELKIIHAEDVAAVYDYITKYYDKERIGRVITLLCTLLTF